MNLIDYATVDQQAVLLKLVIYSSAVGAININGFLDKS
jgi:hypothetical protein